MSEKTTAVILNELEHIKNSLEKIEKSQTCSNREHQVIRDVIEKKGDKYYEDFAHKGETNGRFSFLWKVLYAMITISVAQLFAAIYFLLDKLFR